MSGFRTHRAKFQYVLAWTENLLHPPGAIHHSDVQLRCANLKENPEPCVSVVETTVTPLWAKGLSERVEPRSLSRLLHFKKSLSAFLVPALLHAAGDHPVCCA
jgi:hypothetical protein